MIKRLALLLPLLLGAPAAIGQTATPIVFDSESLLRHRIVGETSVAVPPTIRASHLAVDIQVSISATGEIVSVAPDPRSLQGRDSDPALAAVRGWRFRPLTYHGVPVAARGVVQIVYRGQDQWRDPDASLPPIDYPSLRIRLMRSACYGSCPDYAVTIDGEGNVLFSTRDPPLPGAAQVHRQFSRSVGVLIGGIHRAQIDRAALDALIEHFRAAHFFGLKPEYRAGITDNPTYELTFATGGRSWTVTDYVGASAGMPAVVTSLEDAVDAATGSARWVAGGAGTVASLRTEGFDFTGQAAANMATFAAYSDQASDQFLIELIGAGVPLERPVSMGDEALPLGVRLVLAAVVRHRRPVLDLLAGRGWLARVPRDRLSQAFAEGAGGCDPATARMLITAGADPMARTAASGDPLDPGRMTALMRAVRPYGACEGVDRARLITALVALGVDANAVNDAGETALYGVEDPDVQDALLAAGVRADSRNRAGRSAAFSSWNDRIVLGLLDAGADPHGRYDDGYSMRRQAHERDMPAVLAWLDAHHIQ